MRNQNITYSYYTILILYCFCPFLICQWFVWLITETWSCAMYCITRHHSDVLYSAISYALCNHNNLHVHSSNKLNPRWRLILFETFSDSKALTRNGKSSRILRQTWTALHFHRCWETTILVMKRKRQILLQGEFILIETVDGRSFSKLIIS